MHVQFDHWVTNDVVMHESTPRMPVKHAATVFMLILLQCSRHMCCHLDD